MKELWEDRYSKLEYAYGEEPNKYLKEQLTKINPGKILFPAEGEGRNAVFAAKIGWQVYAFDISQNAKNKALKLANKNQVEIDYQVGELKELHHQENKFDVIALVYAHFPSHLKSIYLKELIKFLKKDGLILFEAFSKKHLEYNSKNKNVGGPKDIDMLFSIDEIRSDFENFEVLELTEIEIELHEGIYHNGIGSVIRFIGRKN